MSEPMTDTRLAEIAAREERVRKGNWRYNWERITSEDESTLVDIVDSVETDIPALLAEVARLNARVAELETPNMFWSEESDSSADSDGEECAIEMADYNLEPHEFPNVINVRCARSLPTQHYRVDMGEDFKITATLVDSDAAREIAAAARAKEDGS